MTAGTVLFNGSRRAYRRSSVRSDCHASLGFDACFAFIGAARRKLREAIDVPEAADRGSRLNVCRAVKFKPIAEFWPNIDAARSNRASPKISIRGWIRR